MKHTASLKMSPRGDHEVVVTRVFEAPLRRVFDAFTKPELLMRWLLSPTGWALKECDVDLQLGGTYRRVWRSPENREMSVRGVYREIIPLKRIVYTERFLVGWYPGEALITLTFAEHGGRTTVTLVMHYESKSARDVVLASPLESGIAESFDRLDEVLSRKP